VSEEAVEPTEPDPEATPVEVDLAGIEADLDGVQAALTRLADGTYWTDEVTGSAIPADVLVTDPLARRA
jgi:RNA polymerase-binding transcription factor DksA